MSEILALDLATKMGYYDGTLMGTIKFNKETRVSSYWNFLRHTVHVDRQRPYDAVVVENAIGLRGVALEVFHELKSTTKLVCQLADIPLYEYSPKTVKKVFTGNGNASKEDVIKKCLDIEVEIPYKILKGGPNKGSRKYDDDIADAVAIYYTHKETING